MSKFDQPSEAAEAANAAYIWRRQVQVDLVQELKDFNIKLDKAEFWFERFRRAYQREIDAEIAAKAEKA